MENFRQETLKDKGPLIELSPEKKIASVTFPNLELSAENPRSPEVRIVIEKQPIELVEGRSYSNHAVLIDKETEGMKTFAEEVETLLGLPEKERPARVLEIFRNRMRYAYNDTIEELSETDPDLAKWVAENTGLNSSASNVPLSQILEKGYGVCRHLAVAYLWLAQKAGLKGVILGSDWSVLKNIKRRDTGEKLFKSAKVGQPITAPHSWVEIKTSDGQWIPVDPSTNLVGDNEDSLAMFQEANYMALGGVGLGLKAEVEPRDKLSLMSRPIIFSPAEARASGIASLELRSTKPTIRLEGEDLPPTNTPYSGEGKLTICTSEKFGGYALKIVSVEEEFITKEGKADRGEI